MNKKLELIINKLSNYQYFETKKDTGFEWLLNALWTISKHF